MKKSFLFWCYSLMGLFAFAQSDIIDENVQYLCAKNYKAPAQRDAGATIYRSDTIDLLHFDLTLHVTDFTNQTIAGACRVEFRSKMDNIQTVVLDLLKLNIDSVVQEGQLLSFDYSDSASLVITLLNTLQTSDSTAVTVHYRGKPQGDLTLFGGFTFQGNYAYNIGVGPSYIPHMVGRAWFPCFDNFVERATLDFHIITASNRMALCNGALVDSVDNGNGTTTWNWSMKDKIPSYLTNVMVGPYVLVKRTYNGLNGPVPVQMASASGDTTRMKGSFVNMQAAFNVFENSYGPYRWNKVGIGLVPFNNVAMEHATNITYPATFVNGNTNYENIMVHELAHQWWGNQVTPLTVEDYWLKEGFSVYSEKIFFEQVYNKARFYDEMMNTLEKTLRVAHIFDQGYRAAYPMPEQYTYGKTVYDKGGCIVHSLRGYLGDSLFFHCLKSYLDDFAFSAQSSETMRDYLTACSGINMDDFFADWVFAPGFTHFTVDTFITTPNGSNYDVSVYIRQRVNHAPRFYKNVPVEITFMDANRNRTVKTAMASGACTVFHTTIPINPVFAGADVDDKLSLSSTENSYTLSKTGINGYKYGKMSVRVNNITDSSYLRVEHCVLPADPLKNPIPGLHLSQERFWKVDGVFNQDFDANATITYDGRVFSPPTSSGSFYQDRYLITNSEDSLVMLYRPSYSADWEIDTSAKVAIGGNANDKTGNINIGRLRKGEYVMAIYQADKVDSVWALQSPDTCAPAFISNSINDFNGGSSMRLYPNPARDQFTLDGYMMNSGMMEVFNTSGQLIYQSELFAGLTSRQVRTSEWGNGVFFVRIRDTEQRRVMERKLVVLTE